MTTSAARDLAKTEYVALTTYRKDGTGVTTPVWIAPLSGGGSGGELGVITLADSWKVKRLRRDGRVRLQTCDVRGRVRPDSPTWEATGRVADTPEELAWVRTAMSRKYWMARLGNTAEDLLGGLMRRKPRVGIVLSDVRLS